MNPDTLLMVADTDRDANMLYAVGMFVPDPFIYLQFDGKPHIVMSDLEIDRARASARHCRVLSLSAYQQRLRRNGQDDPKLQDVIALILKEKKIRKITVPNAFPIGLARDLKQHGFKVKALKSPLFPSRETKTSDEVKKISASLTMAEVGLAEGIHALHNAKVGRKGELLSNHIPLTSERLRSIINTAVIQAGGVASHTIVSCGAQSCDPNGSGSGPLFANKPIIIEVLPRSQKTGYYGDITRTVVKGRATETLRRLYHTVATAQELAFSKLTDGHRASKVHRAIAAFFHEQGYQTRRRGGRIQGFFHSTGNGLGLESAEYPRITPTSRDTLRAGQIVTIGPGLYYSELGGVRLKDVACLTKSKPRNLTKFEKILEV